MSDAARRAMKHSQSIRSRIVGVNIPRGERIATALVGEVCTRSLNTCKVRNERTCGPNGGRGTE